MIYFNLPSSAKQSGIIYTHFTFFGNSPENTYHISFNTIKHEYLLIV